MRPYRLLAAVPHALPLLICGLLGRLYVPAIPLVMTFLIVDWTGSYAIGGAVAAALTIGQGVAGPLRGRAADRRSATRILVLTSAGYATGLAVMTLLAGPGGVLPASWWWLILPVAFVTGLFFSPIGQMNRAIMPRIADGPARNAAYAVEATLQELMFVVSPTLAAFAVVFWGAVISTLLCAGVAVLGSVAYAITLVRAGLQHAPARAESTDRKPDTSLFATTGFVPMLAFSVLMVGGVVAIDLVLIGWARNRGTPELAGYLAAVWAFSSLLGGLWVGGLARLPRLWLCSGLAAAGIGALVPVLPPVAEPAEPVIVGVILLVGGAAIAPTLAAMNGRLADIAPRERRTEAFGWIMSAGTVGVALSSPTTGWLLDTVGPAAAAGMSAVMALLATLLASHHSSRTSPARVPGEDTVVT